VEPSSQDYITSTLFEEDYWLDAAAPGQWAAIEERQDGKVIGRLPFLFKKKRGIKLVTQPPYTPWLGPWIRSSGGKLTNELSHQHQVLEQLIKQLPLAHVSTVNCAPEFTNLMAFRWAGYKLSMGYTYRLNDLKNEKVLWDGLRDTVRRLCRKAEKQTVVTKQRTVKDFIGLLEKTFQRQGQDISSTFAALERIDEAMSKRNQREIYIAEDAQGRLHSGAYIVFDKRHSVYLAGGADPALRDSGAQALSMWHAVKESGIRSHTFDFEGSSVPAIEYFVRGFGPVQQPRFTATRCNGFGRLWSAWQAMQ
jgi:hypothetical protein